MDQSSPTDIRIGGELPFRLALTGYAGHLRVEPLPPVARDTPLSALPDLILPPALPRETPETLRESIEHKYLTPLLDHEADSAEICGKMWDFEWLSERLPDLEPTVPRTAVIPVWEPPFQRKRKQKQNPSVVENKEIVGDKNVGDLDSWIPEFEEVDVIHHAETADNSSSVLRRPGPMEDFVRGSTSNHPFLPGGFDISHALDKGHVGAESAVDGLQAILVGGPLHSVPPGFTKGLDFGTPEPFLACRHNVGEDFSVERSQRKSKNLELGQSEFKDLFKRAWEHEKINEMEEEGGVSNEANPGVSVTEEDWKEAIEAEITVLDKILADVKEEKKLQKSREQKKAGSEDWAIKGGAEGVVERFSEFVPDLALSFPFELDRFQKEAIYHLERSESVFVAAHTSAGKTVVAEYAFALATKHCTRAVYTSPIKTISNQKYRDFSDRFDVGIITGDISLKPEASCLIMTTEILRSMLYKGADIIRDIEWVIFDEVHYINDAERGVVWEEVIIMLPDHVNMVLLSATVPNAMEFANWIGRTKRKKIFVTGTSRRPVPLEHCLYYSGELYKICENNSFLPQGVKEARDAFNVKNSPKVGTPARGSAAGRGGSGRGSSVGKGNPGPKGSGPAGSVLGTQRSNNIGGWKSETSQWYSLINNLSKKGLLPVVVFCFSKNRCDKSADSLTAADLTSTSEKREIRVFCDKGFSRLKGSDRHLPQVVRLEDLLRRGIGVHHAGLLPIVKEVVEMLFCRGVIKVLFSTETFAMGVNAPARTVAFHSLRKHDGKTFRQLLPGEYTQMAGRAGRRGLDKVGTVVIMCWEDIPEEGELKRLLTGVPMNLESQFRLTYNMILNLLRVEDLKVEDMLKRSFAEFHAQRALPMQQQQLKKEEGELSLLKSTINCILGEPTIEDYYEIAVQAEVLRESIQEAIMQSRVAQQLLVPGRVVIVYTSTTSVPALGVVLKSSNTTPKTWVVLAINRETDISQSRSTENDVSTKSFKETGYFISQKNSRGFEDEYTVSRKGSRKGSGVVNVNLPYFGITGGTGYVAKEVTSHDFSNICKAKIQVDAVGLLEDVSSAAYSLTVQQLLQLEKDYAGKDPPVLDPIKDLKLNDPDVIEKYRARQFLIEKMAENPCHRCPKLQDHYTLVRDQHTLRENVKKLRFELSDEALQQMPDFQLRIGVLKEVGSIDAELGVQLKGRVACEINSGDELIATECLFDNQLAELDPAEAVALLSALVFQQKDASEPMLTPRLKAAKERMIATAIRLGHIQKEHGLLIEPQDYAQQALKFGLVEVVYEWAKGTPFAQICELTDVPEGSIVRTIVRLDETCREFRNAARIIGDSNLHKKMLEASEAIKRDIVFAASLYVTGVSN